MDVAGCRAIGNHRHWKRGGVGWKIQNLDVENRGKAAEPLGPDAQVICRFIYFESQLFQFICRTAFD